ncbi:hypothetical protein N7493_003714 [Penicillium malachiteum]|uniref:Uncharacterized protein n=1 Tax=Penicillium malachiteum TaxID=1324776 RepID=A0AAD6HR63_9EURO|nr:hypothetical protein N7493_003714 [Penicillium malachiteum]
MDPQRSGPNNQGQALEDPPNNIEQFHEFCDEFERQALRNPTEMLPTEYVLDIVKYMRNVVNGLADAPHGHYADSEAKNEALSTSENPTILSSLEIFRRNFVDDSADFNTDCDAMSTDESTDDDTDYEIDQEELESLNIKVHQKINLVWEDILDTDDEVADLQNPFPDTTLSHPSHPAAHDASRNAEVANMEKAETRVEHGGIKNERDSSTSEHRSVTQSQELTISIPATTFTIRWRNSASPFKWWHKVRIGSISMGSRTHFLARVMMCIRTAIEAIRSPMFNSLTITGVDVNSQTGDVRVHVRTRLERDLLLRTSNLWLPYVDRGHLTQVWYSQNSDEVQHIGQAQAPNAAQSHDAQQHILAPSVEIIGESPDLCTV